MKSFQAIASILDTPILYIEGGDPMKIGASGDPSLPPAVSRTLT